MLLDLALMTAFLVFGNVKFRHFEPFAPMWRRVLKVLVTLAITGVISWYFGHKGFLIALGIAMLPVVYVHGIWLPKHGVNGWTGEPRDKYYALRRWPVAPVVKE